MASRKTKYYTGTITLPNGKRKYIRGRTKEDLDQKMTQFRMELSAGVDISSDTTFGAYAELWYNTVKRPRLRKNSASTQLYTLNKYVLPILDVYSMRDIKPMHIQQLLSSVSGMSKSTQAKVIQVTRAVFLSAVDNGVILRSPVKATDKPGGSEAREMEALTPEQSDTLLRATWGTRAYTFVLIALRTGMRRGEILGLMWEDVDFDAELIRVRHNKVFIGGKDTPVTELLKSSAAHRELPLPDDLRLHLLAMKARSLSQYVLSMPSGEALSPSSFASLWRVVTSRTTDDPEKLGKPLDARHPHLIMALDFQCHPHLLRHTYITRLFEAGLDMKEIQYLAGHSTIEMTLRVYTHYCRKSRAEETAQKVKSAFPKTVLKAGSFM